MVVDCYPKKNFFDNEPFCPFCGKEITPLYFDDKERGEIRLGAGINKYDYCLNCKIIWYIETIYFSMKKVEKSEFKVIIKKKEIK